MTPTQDKLAPEAAEAEFRSWLEDMGLAFKVDDPKLTAEDRDSLEKAKLPIMEAIKKGRLIRNEAGEFVFTPQLGDTSPITFYEPTGADLMQMDKVGRKDENVAKTYGILASMTRQNQKRFADMKNRDLDVCKGIMGFFLGR